MQLSTTAECSSHDHHRDSGPSRRDELITETLWLVRALAAELLRLHGFSISREDLEACGMRGLVCAADAYDYRVGTRFSTFAYPRIRGAMFDAIRDGYGQCTRTEMSVMQELGRGQGSRPRFDLNRGKRVTDVEHLPRLTNFLSDIPCQRHASESGVAHTGHADLQRHLLRPDLLVDERVVAERVRTAIAKLPARTRQVLELLYFEHDGSYEAVARHLGMTRPHIFRVHARALRRLRAVLADLAP